MNSVDEKAGGVSTARRRVSLLLLLVGVAALLIGVGLYVRRDRSQLGHAASPAQTDPSSVSDNLLASTAFQTWLVYSTVILIVFVAASYTIARIGRRYRIQLVRKPHDVTPTPDIWRMHRPPEDTGSSGFDHESGTGAS
jgi:hypothetical protein